MNKKIFDDYVEFLQYSKDNIEKGISNIRYANGRLLSYKVGSYRCICPFFDISVSPSKMAEMCGVNNYNAFLHFNFDKLKNLTNNEGVAYYWKNGYFGGLIGVNTKIVNNFVGTGEINTFYDYDINSAYMYELTRPLPCRLEKTMTKEEFDKLSGVDKFGKIYFYKIKVKDKLQGKYASALGRLKGIYEDFDFLSTRQHDKMIVSELRFLLMQQIYFNNFEIIEIYQFKSRRFGLFRRIVENYMILKKQQPELKKSGLQLYGCLGKIYNKKYTSLSWSVNQLNIDYELSVNWNSIPYVSMWVADNVAYRLFGIISNNLDCILSWNTDGFTSTKKINLPISTKYGKWKCTKFVGNAFLVESAGKTIIYRDIDGNYYGANNIIEKGKDIYTYVDIFYTHLKKGYVQKTIKTKLDLSLQFDKSKKFRNLIHQEIFREKILREYVRF